MSSQTALCIIIHSTVLIDVSVNMLRNKRYQTVNLSSPLDPGKVMKNNLLLYPLLEAFTQLNATSSLFEES